MLWPLQAAGHGQAWFGTYLLLNALRTQDMYLAGSFLMCLAFLTVLGVLVSDLALAFLDPRIRLGGGASR